MCKKKKWPSFTELILGYAVAFSLAWLLLMFAESILETLLK